MSTGCQSVSQTGRKIYRAPGRQTEWQWQNDSMADSRAAKEPALVYLQRTYQFLNRQVLRPGTWDFLLDSVSCVVGWMIFGNFYIRSTRSFKDKLIWRLGMVTKWGTQNRVKYAWYQKNKGTLLSQLFMKFDKMKYFFYFVHVQVCLKWLNQGIVLNILNY